MASHGAIIEEAIRLVEEGISVTLPVKGRSMLPFIVGGSDSVILQRTGELKTGDVVLAWVDGCRYVIHRVIRIEGEDVTLMGDGNLSATERCRVSDIKALVTHKVDATGKVQGIYTRKGRWLAWIWRMLRPVRRYLLWGIMKIK